MDSLESCELIDIGSMSIRKILTIVLCAQLLVTGTFGCRSNAYAPPLVRPEQTSIVWRPPEALPSTPIPTFHEPRTVSNPDNGLQPLKLSLDEAVRIALQNSEVVRVLTGFTASSSGSTIYDPGIANTAIDRAQGRFDPQLSINNTFSDNESARGGLIGPPPGAAIFGSDTDAYLLDGSLSQTNPLGGISALRFGVTRTESEPGIFALNPQTDHFTELSYVQPLLQGAGIAANEAPVLIARIETERSFFQFKGSVQQLVQGVVDAYWSLVFARTDRWARQQQVDQADFAYERELARKERELGDLADVAQTRVALTSFRSSLVAAKSNVLQREAALLNILGLSPTEIGEVIPVTPPHEGRLGFDWQELISLAETYRPDLIELKLIIEADQQQVLLARNNAQPQLDATALYRWDGLRGRTPTGTTLATDANELMDWTIGVNFSVPLGLRQARADVRQRELLVKRDQANLNQGLHNAVHQIALSVRTLDQSYEQYLAILETRSASQDNLLVQQAEFENGRSIFLNVLQAIVDWGNAVSSEAQTLANYNSELANLELQTGTILETHGIRFMEEKFCFAGPQYCLQKDRCYPGSIFPSENAPKYEVGDQPAEESFDLSNPVDEYKKRKSESVPRTLDDLGLGSLGVSVTSMHSLSRLENIKEFVAQPTNSIAKEYFEAAVQSDSDVVRELKVTPKNKTSSTQRKSLFETTPVSFGWQGSDEKASLVPQRFNRVEPAGLSRRVESEEDTDGTRKENRHTRSGQ